MAHSTYEKVCYSTSQRDEHVCLRNKITGEVGRSFGCTFEGTTVQVQLLDGSLDSWAWNDCAEEEDETTH